MELNGLSLNKYIFFMRNTFNFQRKEHSLLSHVLSTSFHKNVNVLFSAHGAFL